MRRISPAENSVPDPITGKDSWKTPDGITEDSILTPDLLNVWQEEISTVIEGAGITLDGTKTDQLKEAIKRNDRITADTDIGTGVADLHEAFELLRGRFIDPGVTVTIQVPNLISQALSYPAVMDHPQGDQIVIQGFVSDINDFPLTFNATTGNFPAGCKVLSAASGSTLRLKYGRLLREGTASLCDGVSAYPGGRVIAEDFNVDGVYGTGYAAREGSLIELDGCNSSSITGTDVEDFVPISGVAFYAVDGGVLKGSSIGGNSPTGFHVLADKGGMININNCIFEYKPIGAFRGGILRADIVDCYAPGDYAFQADRGGFVYLTNCNAGNASNSPAIGFYCDYSAYLEARTCSADFCLTYSFYCLRNGYMNLSDCISSNMPLRAEKFGKIRAGTHFVSLAAAGICYYAIKGGSIEAVGSIATATVTGVSGFVAEDDSSMQLDDCGVTLFGATGLGYVARTGSKLITAGNCAVTGSATTSSYFAVNHSYLYKGASTYTGSAAPSPTAGSNDTTLSRID